MTKNDIVELDLNLLKVFEALYEEGGAGRAAVRLGITQSAVSASLARLRRVYGDHLFERTGRGLKPTAKSEELRPVISAALEKCRQTLLLCSKEVQAFAGRTLTLGLSDDYEIAIGRALINMVSERAPGLRLIFKQTHSMIASEALMARKIDVSLTAGSVPSRAIGRRVLTTGDYSCLIALPEGKEMITLSRDEYLRRGHLLVSSGGYVGIVDEVLAASSAVRKVEAATTHFAALPFLLKGSDSVATLPTHAARALADTTGLSLCPCPVELPRYSVELGWRMDSARDPALQLLVGLITEAYRALGLPDASLNRCE
ncbi:LysR family transcriptional regulator [Pseudomonas putida]|nr:LysR family transcriptional regulator [Pseudomonas putida]